MLALRLVENVLLYFGSEATQREQFGWNGCGTKWPDHTECKFSVDIPWVVFRVEPEVIHSRESARNIPAFSRGEGLFFRERSQVLPSSQPGGSPPKKSNQPMVSQSGDDSRLVSRDVAACGQPSRLLAFCATAPSISCTTDNECFF